MRCPARTGDRLKVAAVNWKITALSREQDFFDHLCRLVEAAASRGADIIVLPELPVLELLSLVPSKPPHEGAEWLARFAPAFEAELTTLAMRTSSIIVGGSHFRFTESGIRNSCAVAFPHQRLLIQEKVKLTTYEREEWLLEPGTWCIKDVVQPLGVTICYDSEFPESGRSLAEAGVMVQCVPAFTETEHGFHRVRWSCHARSVENQIFTVHSSLVGSLGSEPVPSAYGSSAVLAPCVEPFPADGVICETQFGEEDMCIADLDLAMLEEARHSGDVRNWDDRDPSPWLTS